MENFKLIIVGLFLFLIAACNSTEGTNSESKDSTKVDTEEAIIVDTVATKADVNENNELGKEYTAKYICPNHCKDSGSDKEGECSNCGMEFMENPNFQGE